MGRIPTIHDQDIGDNIELIFPFLEGGMSLAEAKEEQNAANFTQAKERLKTKLLPIQNRQLARMIQHMAMQKAKNEAELLPPPDVLEEKDVMDKHKLYVMEKVNKQEELNVMEEQKLAKPEKAELLDVMEKAGLQNMKNIMEKAKLPNVIKKTEMLNVVKKELDMTGKSKLAKKA